MRRFLCAHSPQLNDPSQRDEIDLRQPMVSTTSQVGSPLLSRSVRCLRSPCVQWLLRRRPTWFYNPLLSSFRRSRPNRCDVRAMRERSPATGPQRRPSPRHTKLQDSQGTQRRGRGSQSFWRTSVLFADAVSNNKKASIFHKNTIFKSYVYLS